MKRVVIMTLCGILIAVLLPVVLFGRFLFWIFEKPEDDSGLSAVVRNSENDKECKAVR